MAKKNDKRTMTRKERMEERAALERAAQLQAEKERKIQTAIGAVVVGIVVIILAVVGYFVISHIYENSKSSDQVSAERYAAVQKIKDKPENATPNGGFIISKNGLNKPVKGVPTIDDYMDFICPACGILNRAIDPELNEMVAAGQINLSIHPSGFLDLGSTDHYSTRSAAFVAYVADKEPDKVLPLISELFDEKVQPHEASEYKSVSNADLTKLAEKVGVSQKVAEDAAKGTYEKWIEALSRWYVTEKSLWNTTGSLKGQMTTPTVLINGHYWDFNTLMTTYNKGYNELLLASLGIKSEDVGKPGILPSIGTGAPIDLAKVYAPAK